MDEIRKLVNFLIERDFTGSFVKRTVYNGMEITEKCPIPQLLRDKFGERIDSDTNASRRFICRDEINEDDVVNYLSNFIVPHTHKKIIESEIIEVFSGQRFCLVRKGVLR